MSSNPCRTAILVTLLAALGLLGACRDTGTGPFAISARLFEFNYRLGIATYVIVLRPEGPLDEGQVAVVQFQDPAGGAPLEIRQPIWPKLPHQTLTSPPLTCVTKDRPYAVSIRIEDAQGAVKQTLETTVTSSLDQTVLPDRPLVVGPLYDPNPDLAGHPGGKLPDQPSPVCPA